MLYLVATPIGNLDDITLRALETLKSADVIAAEDTRHSGNLLQHFEIRKPLISYHEHNEAMRAEQLAERLAAGDNVALITDAGMPGLSDPGARLIRKCIERDLPYTIGNFNGTALFPWIPAGEKRPTRTRAACGCHARGNFRVL
jgi:16S rRNA (cytidine1402-2'-O)-methyltransferase